jgi:hypothetical protein
LAQLMELAFRALRRPSPPVNHLAGVLNSQADVASRQWLPDRAHLEWPASPSAFRSTWSRLTGAPPPPSTIDAFASPANAKTPLFWSWQPSPFALATDALAQPWEGLTLWLNPPFHLLGEVVRKLLREPPALAVLITPDWPAPPWRHQLATHCPPPLPLDPANFIEHGPTTHLAEPLRNPRWKLLAWCLRGRQ